MSWEIAVVAGLLGTAAIFAYFAVAFKEEAKWISIFFFMMVMYMMVVNLEVGMRLIDNAQQSNLSITGYTSNATNWNILRDGYSVWQRPFTFAAYLLVLLFVILLLVDILQGIGNIKQNRREKTEGKGVLIENG